MNEAVLISSPVCFVDQGSLLYMHYAEVVDVNPERQLLLVRQKTWINIAKLLHQDSVEAKQVTSESSFTLVTVLQQKKGGYSSPQVLDVYKTRRYAAYIKRALRKFNKSLVAPNLLLCSVAAL